MSPVDDWRAVSRGNTSLPLPADAFCRGGHDNRHRLATRARATRGCGVLGSVSVGRARSDRAHRRDDGHACRARRHARRPSAQALGQRSIDYRHYLPELARKPQAVRQVLPELLRDLGAPFAAVWDHFHSAHQPREAARLLAKVLGQLDTHGFDVVVPAVDAALRAGTPVLLALTPGPAAPVRLDAEVVPAALRHLEVPSGCAADYDGWLAEAV